MEGGRGRKKEGKKKAIDWEQTSIHMNLSG